jgi:hypothetical protein
MGVLLGRVPYRDFYVNAAPLSSYLWAPLVLVSMVATTNYSTNFVNYDNYLDSSSMLLLSYIFRIFFVICIILSALILYKLELKRENKHSFTIALLYCVNPFFLHLVSFWGSDECIVPLLILLPIYLFEKGNKTAANIVIVLGAGFKYFPILLAPLIWIYGKKWKDRITQTLVFVTGLAVIVLPLYFLSPSEFLFQFKDKITAPGNAGIITVIQEFFHLNIENIGYIFPIITILMLGLVSLVLFLRRKNWSYHQTISLLLVYLIFFHKMQISYLAMIVPFLYIGAFAKVSIKILNISLYIFGVFEGYFAPGLINHTLEKIVWQVFSWIEISIFYVLMIIATILYTIKNSNVVTRLSSFEEKTKLDISKE